MKSKALLGTAIVSLLVAAYWSGSPLVALYLMKKAATSGDAASFNEYVDYGRLRINLKERIEESFSAVTPNEPGTSRPTIRTGFAQLVAAKAVDTLIRPEVVMQLMRIGKLIPGDVSEAPASKPSAPKKPSWSIHYEGINQFIVTVQSTGDGSKQPVAVVLSRKGFASWQMTDIRLLFPDKAPSVLRPMPGGAAAGTTGPP